MYCIGIDVGTGSARAGIVDSHNGAVLALASKEIQTWQPQPDYYEQSSSDIWNACCDAVREAVAKSKVKPAEIIGIGFDATCSLVAIGADDQPVSVSPTHNDEQNIIVWMDHRAIDQSTRINNTQHIVLTYVGGSISPEMETPKLLWLKENLPQQWEKTAQYFDLVDFLTYRATGDNTRSLCTVVCKWTYLGHEGRWDDTYFRQVGLEDLVDQNYLKIGRKVRYMGEPAGCGLTAKAAAEFGLLPGTPVGVGIIDAHAGGLGVLGAVLPGDPSQVTQDDLAHRLAMVSGTSTCHMAVSQNPLNVPGVWGPYYSAMVPGLWLAEGGEGATGSLFEHVLTSHAGGALLKEKAAKAGAVSVYSFLNALLLQLAQKYSLPSCAFLTRSLHVLPYYHGNRSPRADPLAVGAVSGLKLSSDLEEDLALHYLATIQAVAYGTRHIIDAMNARGYSIDTIFVTGGNAKNELFVQEHADITGCRVVLSRETDAVLLGASILGAVAGGAYPDVLCAMSNMCAPGKILYPQSNITSHSGSSSLSVGGYYSSNVVKEYHDAKYEVFLSMYEHQVLYRAKMQKFNS